jgi:hypothetical protein
MIEVHRQGQIRFGENRITATGCAVHERSQQADRQQQDERQPGQPACLLFAPAMSAKQVTRFQGPSSKATE